MVSDSFLRDRNTQDHEATAMMKAQFMCLWDGFASSGEHIIELPHQVTYLSLSDMYTVFLKHVSNFKDSRIQKIYLSPL